MNIHQFMDLLTHRDVQRDLARRAKQERLRLNITQKELAKRAQVGEVTVRRLESGLGVSLSNFLRIASILGCLPAAEDLMPRREPRTLDSVKPVTRRRARRRKT